MEKKIKEKNSKCNTNKLKKTNYNNCNLKSTKGITLIALVITIIVLLILAGVSLSMILNQDGIFSRAEQATEKYSGAKARETLEMAFSDLQIEKYEQGLTLEDLDNRITEEINKMGGEEIGDNKNEVIVDGYIFEVDRTIPKIVDELGEANGVVITAKASKNNCWIKEGETITLTGTVKTYSGGTITKATITRDGATTDLTLTDGRYAINDITKTTEITIYAQDSNKKENSKYKKIEINVDRTAPTVETLNAKAEGLKIIFSATGHDKNAEGIEESGMDYFTYTITSTEDTTLEGIPEDKRTGAFKQGETVKIETTATSDREETTYSIKVIATDNAKNTTNNTKAKIAKITTIDGITIEEAKRKINENILKEYIGKRVVDYNPPTGGAWRIFYYDGDNYFGDGVGTIYIKREQVDTNFGWDSETTYPEPTMDAIEKMKQMNPKWRESELGEEVDTKAEKYVASLYDTTKWEDYYDNGAKYVIGAPSVELFQMSYNTFVADSNKMNNRIGKKGYELGTNGSYLMPGDADDCQSSRIEADIKQLYLGFPGSVSYRIGSIGYNGAPGCVETEYRVLAGFTPTAYGRLGRCCPIACLK